MQWAAEMSTFQGSINWGLGNLGGRTCVLSFVALVHWNILISHVGSMKWNSNL
jgi:hypothetical protein